MEFNLNINFNKINIVFFSGTGCSAHVASTFQNSLKAKGKIVIMHQLHKKIPITEVTEDLLILIYPVHACNAPEPVYEYIHEISAVDKTPAVVISVSGGGEITPNTACRLHCIKRLTKKGFNVMYEHMIVMPSNWMIPTADGLAVRLLEVLPGKVEKIINDLFTGVNRRSKPDILNRLLSNIGELEKYGAKFLGKRITVNQNCNGCGWCESACPTANIITRNSRPVFTDRCSLCLKCIYGCPRKALTLGFGKFIVIRHGFNLDSVKKQVGGIKSNSIEELAKGYLWKGVKEYLLDE